VYDLDLACKPDAARAWERMDAWWNHAILDRPTIQITAPMPTRRSAPEKRHTSLRDRWMDAEHAVACFDASAAGTYWAGEILPAFFPNLGPEILTAAYGAEMDFGEHTSWSIPCLHDWADVPKLSLNPDGIYVRKILEATRLGLEAGRGKWITGITDIHPGADLAASLRDPQQFCVDLVAEPERAHELLERIRSSFFEFYELQHAIMRDAGQKVTTSWLPLFCGGRYYIPSNDFSCMVSNAMFVEFFVPELLDEIEWLDRSVYHLDGPGALRHLDTLLAIPKLGAIQWVFGAGNEPASKWMHVLQRIQAAGKNIHISIESDELDTFMENLAPEGVMLRMGASSVEEADALIARVARWTRKGVRLPGR
jgi:hypothetical protein